MSWAVGPGHSGRVGVDAGRVTPRGTPREAGRHGQQGMELHRGPCRKSPFVMVIRPLSC